MDRQPTGAVAGSASEEAAKAALGRPRWKLTNTLTRALLFGWESRIDRDPHDLGPDEADHVFTYSVVRGTGDDRQVLVEDVDCALADAIEQAIGTLDSLIAHARGEGPQ